MSWAIKMGVGCLSIWATQRRLSRALGNKLLFFWANLDGKPGWICDGAAAQKGKWAVHVASPLGMSGAPPKANKGSVCRLGLPRPGSAPSRETLALPVCWHSASSLSFYELWTLLPSAFLSDFQKSDLLIISKKKRWQRLAFFLCYTNSNFPPSNVNRRLKKKKGLMRKWKRTQRLKFQDNTCPCSSSR